MLIASRNGDITVANLVKETDKEWLLDIPYENRQVHIRKTDTYQRPFNDMNDALTWAGAEPALIEHFANQSKEKTKGQLPFGEWLKNMGSLDRPPRGRCMKYFAAQQKLRRTI